MPALKGLTKGLRLRSTTPPEAKRSRKQQRPLGINRTIFEVLGRDSLIKSVIRGNNRMDNEEKNSFEGVAMVILEQICFEDVAIVVLELSILCLVEG